MEVGSPTDSGMLNSINGAPEADPRYLCLHNDTGHANQHQYIECTSIRVGMLKQINFERSNKEHFSYLYLTHE